MPEMREETSSVDLASSEAALTVAQAEWLEALAIQKRIAAGQSSALWAIQRRAEAEGLEAVARRARDAELPDLRLGCGSEVAPRVELDAPAHIRDVAQTVRQSPDNLAADASLERLQLARNADVLALAVELAQDSGATTAAEKMLAHQLAAAHRLGMGLIATAADELHKHRVAAHVNPGAAAEAVRCANAGARVMAAFSQGALALDRLRNGGRQVVTVQHVTVADGGQAVVAGTVKSEPGAPASEKGGARRR
jgi:hypothetical protein